MFLLFVTLIGAGWCVLETTVNPRGLAGPFTYKNDEELDLWAIFDMHESALEARVLPPDCIGDNYDVLADGLWCVRCKYYNVPTCNGDRYTYCSSTIGTSSFCSTYYDYSDPDNYGVCGGSANTTVDLSLYTSTAYDLYLSEAQELFRQCRLGIGNIYGFSNGKCCSHVEDVFSPTAWCPTPCRQTELTDFKKKSVKFGTQLCKKCCNDCYTDEFCDDNEGKTNFLAGSIFKRDNKNCCDSMCDASKSPASTLSSIFNLS